MPAPQVDPGLLGVPRRVLDQAQRVQRKLTSSLEIRNGQPNVTEAIDPAMFERHQVTSVMKSWSSSFS
jgi:hypothetical protein